VSVQQAVDIMELKREVFELKELVSILAEKIGPQAVKLAKQHEILRLPKKQNG
jgi:hypothetical protein